MLCGMTSCAFLGLKAWGGESFGGFVSRLCVKLGREDLRKSWLGELIYLEGEKVCSGELA